MMYLSVLLKPIYLSNMQIRVKQMKAFRSKGMTLNQVGHIYKLSAERVRQLTTPLEMNVCKKHDRQFTSICSFCFTEKSYADVIRSISSKELKKEIARLSRHDRTHEIVIQRAMLVIYLHEKQKLSFRKISFLLKRDHASIMNLYKKYASKKN